MRRGAGAKLVAVSGGAVIRAAGAELMAPMRLEDEARTSGECSGGGAEKCRVRPLRHKCKSRYS